MQTKEQKEAADKAAAEKVAAEKAAAEKVAADKAAAEKAAADKPAAVKIAYVLLVDVEGVGARGKVFLPIGDDRIAASEDPELSRAATDGERKRGLLT